MDDFNESDDDYKPPTANGLDYLSLYDTVNKQTEKKDGKPAKPKEGNKDKKAKEPKENKSPAAKKKKDDVKIIEDFTHLAEQINEDREKHGQKRLSVERVYQKKTQLEHILLRPDTYIGSVETVTQPMWVWDDENECMENREITFVPGLYKIFDEILVNAADNKQRDKSMSCIKISIDVQNNKISVWNNGKGIPVVEHKVEKVFVPALIFGQLLTSSNFNDEEKKVTGGRNGYGAKLCNVFSTKFIVETASKHYKKAFKQTWTTNMSKTNEPKIAPFSGEDFTCITFYPDLEKFKMTSLDKDIVQLMTRRAYDIAGSVQGVKVFLNGKRLPVKNFKDYMELYIKDKTDETGAPIKIVHEKGNERWEFGVTMSEKGFQNISFVNSIATTKGGRHVDYIADQVVSKLIEQVKKKNKSGISIKPFQVKNHLWIFINSLIENPTFDSQTKENMTLQAKSFGSKCQLTDKFVNNVNKCGIVENVMSWIKFKASTQLDKKCTATKKSKLRGIPKLDDANEAGTKNSQSCTLILTEGDSAKSLAVAGLGIVGRDYYGVFPLKGKVLNVREASHKQIMENAEINNIIKILGLQYKHKYDDEQSLKSLRYGKLMIMTDQDQDGSHIKGLLINFIHHNWPHLLRQRFLEEFITPIVKVTKGKEERSFFSLPEFEEWKTQTENWHSYRVKYYKGLGTSTSKEAKEYFSDMAHHRIPFKYSGTDDDAAIDLAFSKKKVEQRKEWLTHGMEERKQRRILGLPEVYVYGKETKNLTYSDFVNKELILFSNLDNERSIPSLMDGLKPGQRKVLFTCFKRNLTKEFKVAQLAGAVAENSAYHHGEASLMQTIIGLAQNFVGSNNINLLQPGGQFGTRLHGGKDAASPRYIFTCLSPLARHLFHVEDDPCLKYMYDDNQRIEPEWYCPIVPMVLVNGAEGIGTGWSTRIHNYDVRELVANLKRMISGDEPLPLLPAFKNFKGTTQELDEFRAVCSGEISILDNNTVEITELPIRTWTQAYKESVLEPMVYGTEKTPPQIQEYKEYHTDTTVKFVVKMSEAQLSKAEETGLHKFFKLQGSLSMNSMVLFDPNGCIKRYNNVLEILKEFFEIRLQRYRVRKDYLEGMLAAESLRLDNQARFILEKIDGTIVVENKKRKNIIQMLVDRGYDSDPVKSWKAAQAKLEAGGDGADADSDSDSDESEDTKGPDFDYLVGMPMWNLTKEKKDEICKNKEKKAEELSILRGKTPKQLWHEDLDRFSAELVKVEEKEREEEREGPKKTNLKGVKGARVAKPKKALVDTMPSPMGRRVEPVIDPAFRKPPASKSGIKKRKLNLGDGDNSGLGDEFAGDDNEPPSLAERLAGASKLKAEKKSPAGKKEGGKKQGTLAFKPIGKKKSKKNPWSDSEESVSDFDDMGGDSDMDLVVPVEPKARGPRRAAASKAKYKLSDDEDNLFDDEEEDNEMKLNTAVAGNSPQLNGNAAESSDEDIPTKVTAATSDDKPNKFSQDSDSEVMAISDSDSEEKKKKASKPPAKPKAVKPKAEKPKAVPGKKKLGPKLDAKPLTAADSDSDAYVPSTTITDRFGKKSKSAPKKIDKIDKILDSDSDDDGLVIKAAAKKPAQKRKKKPSSSSEDEFSPAKSKKSTAAAKTKKKKVELSDSEADDYGGGGDTSQIYERKTTGRSRKPLKYNFGESDAEDDF